MGEKQHQKQSIISTNIGIISKIKWNCEHGCGKIISVYMQGGK